ncbi:hypothetical protein HRbin30_03241 [bacterium HR30]|nr:hypothetical protein HRbin30_03241 [bacterium HR30]
MPHPLVQVLPPNSIHPFVDIETVVYDTPSILTGNGRLTVASASLPESVVKPEMSSGLWATMALSDTSAHVARENTVKRIPQMTKQPAERVMVLDISPPPEPDRPLPRRGQ